MRWMRSWYADNRLCLLLVFVPVLAMLPWFLIHHTPLALGQNVSIAINQPSPTSVTADEVTARISTFSAAILLLFIATAAGVFGLLRLWHAAPRMQDRGLLVGASALLLTTLVIALYAIHDPLYSLLGEKVFESTLGKIQQGAPLKVLTRELKLANFVVALAATALSAAAAAIAMAARRIRFVVQLEKYDRLSRSLDGVLLAAAAVLVSAIIFIKQWYAWPTAFMNENAKTTFSGLTSAFLGYQSICYVGVLALIYFPAGFFLDRARSRMAVNLKRVGQRLPAVRLVAATAALAPSAPGHLDRLVRLLAITSPVLVGPITTLLPLHS